MSRVRRGSSRAPRAAVTSPAPRNKYLPLIALAWCACAAAVIAPAAQFRFDSWTTDSGLPQATFNSVIQTRDGFIWATTYGGLVRYDGLRFQVFNAGNTEGLRTGRLLQLFEAAETATSGSRRKGRASHATRAAGSRPTRPTTGCPTIRCRASSATRVGIPCSTSETKCSVGRAGASRSMRPPPESRRRGFCKGLRPARSGIERACGCVSSRAGA